VVGTVAHRQTAGLDERVRVVHRSITSRRRHGRPPGERSAHAGADAALHRTSRVSDDATALVLVTLDAPLFTEERVVVNYHSDFATVPPKTQFDGFVLLRRVAPTAH
jgi:hypothetical protein